MTGMRINQEEREEVDQIINHYGSSPFSRQSLIIDLNIICHPSKLTRWKRVGIIEPAGHLRSRTKIWKISSKQILASETNPHRKVVA